MPWDYGMFNVKIYRSGIVHYALIFAEDRLVAGKIGSALGFDEAAVGGTYFGIAGAVLGRRSKMRHLAKLEEEARRLKELTLEEVLKKDTNNFQILYADIEKVVLNDDISSQEIGSLGIVGNITSILEKLGLKATEGIFGKKPRRQVNFSISLHQDIGQCRTIISNVLQDKLVNK